MLSIFDEIQSQVAALPSGVQLWLDWMSVLLISTCFFLKNHKEAWWVLGAMLGTVAVSLGLFTWGRTIYLFGIAHLIFWVPLCVALIWQWRRDVKVAQVPKSNAFRIWRGLLLLTLIISLVFDIRDIGLLFQGQKHPGIS